MTAPGPSARTVGLVVCLVAAVGLALGLALWVPWNPVPGGPPGRADVTGLLSPEQIRRAQEYASQARLLSWSALGTSLVTVVALALPAASRRLVARLRGPWWCRTAAAVALVLLAVQVVTLPFSVALRSLRRDAGLSTQSWGGWARDVVVSLTGEIVLGALVVVVLVALARRWTRAWPAVAALLAAAAVAVGSLLYPVVVEPLFNSFEPLEDGALHTAVMQLAGDEDVRVDDVLVADASRRTTTLNAYVSGLGTTRRVVLYDTLLEALPQDQVLAVVAHELAHARHDDVLTGTALGALGAGAAMGLAGVLLGGPARGPAPGHGRGGRRRLTDVAVVPLLLAAYAVGTQLVSPVTSGVSRQLEMRADVAGLTATGDPEAFVEMQRMLALRSLADPMGPRWSQFWWGTHPTFAQRVTIAERVAADAGPALSLVPTWRAVSVRTSC